MSFWGKISNKISDWRVITAAIAGAAVAYMYEYITFSTYKVFTAEEESVLPGSDEEFKRDMELLKKSINVQSLSSEDLKKIFDFIVKQNQVALNECNLTNKMGTTYANSRTA